MTRLMRDSYNWRLSSERKKEMKRRVCHHTRSVLFTREIITLKKKKPIHIVGTLEEQK
jgi:hypothetical protein